MKHFKKLYAKVHINSSHLFSFSFSLSHDRAEQYCKTNINGRPKRANKKIVHRWPKLTLRGKGVMQFTYHRWRGGGALQATDKNIRDFVWEIYYWDLRTLNNSKPYFFLNEMNKKDLPAMYSTAFWCLFVVLLVFLSLLRKHSSTPWPMLRSLAFETCKRVSLRYIETIWNCLKRVSNSFKRVSTHFKHKRPWNALS